MVVGGHSQGAGTVPLTLAVAPPNVQGGFMSSAGAGLYHSIVHRGDVRALVDGLLAAEPGEIDMFHPYPQVLQTFAEVADPANYASAITADLVLYAGLRDGCTSIETSTHLAEALERPDRQPPGPPAPVRPRRPGRASPATRRRSSPRSSTTPVSQNLPGGRTGAVVQVDSGHFGARTYPTIGRSFIDSIAAGGPVGDRPRPHPAGRPRYAVPPLRPSPNPTGHLTGTSSSLVRAGMQERPRQDSNLRTRLRRPMLYR